ncbi:MAG: ABC transporter ATP-binding protein [Candidatus Marinimicrobia bacterium]|nr:ABC transporter ATP-binding protein [Candidatus Neomarinimicrobiota bacterium]
MINIQNVSKSYRANDLVIDHVSLKIEKGEFVTIIGPSGCGKTTLLRIMNRMTGFNAGKVLVMGRDVLSWDPIQLRRSIGYMIQQGSLFPHLTIKQNIEFVLRISGKSEEVCKERIRQLSAMMGFDNRQLHAYPSSLSGGQQQRAGIARALAMEPEIVLMDEPFSALDNITRRKLQKEIRSMHQELGVTFVMVTHDLQEAFALGERAAIMNKGKIVQYDTPGRIQDHPENDWVRTFISI